MKKVRDKFFVYLRDYLTVFLPKQRNYSPHTIIAVQQVWRMLLSYIGIRTGKRLESLTFIDFNYLNVIGFLDDVGAAKSWKPSTRNHRLARIRAFFRYAAELDPTLVIHLEDLRKIKQQKAPDKSFVLEFMSPEAMAVLLSQPDASTRMGLRDMFFMTLMFDTGARNCEMLSMRLCDLDAKRKVVYLMGKGNKPRYVPINDITVQHFQQYAKCHHPFSGGTSLMFYTVHRGERTPMSDDNVARFLKKYGMQARTICPEIPEKLHPHLLRKSRAMSLYRSGMALSLISEWLGHNDPETTLIYARADMEMKRKAIEKASSVAGTTVFPEAEARIWEGNDSIIRQLLGLNVK